MVGISVIEQGSFVADRYRVVERLTRFAIADSTLTGVEYAYWLALDETRGVEVWLQVAEASGVIASGAELAGVVSALRRLNHPAVPAVLDFGEIEVEVAADDEAADETVVAAVGYVVLEPVEAESLATVLLRGALTEAEILAVLVEAADVLKVLHEVELVHGHLSAYSFLLGERSLLLVDLAAAAALETASASELTPAADVYALAWLACIALAGVEDVEGEFGVGFDAGSSPESSLVPQLLTLDLIERRRAWAALNLVATYGVRAELAQLLIAALGEAAGRPAVGALAAALRIREDVTGAEIGAAAAGAAAVLAAEQVVEAAEAEIEAAELVAAEEVAEAEAAAALVVAGEEVEEIEVAEVVEESEVSESAAAYVGAGVGVGVGLAAGAEASAGGGRGAGGAMGAAAAFESTPVLPPPTSPPGARHGSPPQRPRSALYVAIAIVVLIIVAVAWGCAAGGTSPAPTPSTAATASGQASASGGASPSATAGQAGGSPSASAAASATATAPVGGGAASGTPGYTATPLSTAPASPSQALQQIQQTVSRAESAGQIPAQAQGPINQAIGTLQSEISGNSSTQQGISQLRSALETPGVPSGFVTQINELIPFLVAGQGS